MNPIKGLLDLFGFSDPEPVPHAGTVCGYRLVRSRRRTVSIQVSRGCVTVRAPLNLSLAAIEDFVRSRQDWIAQSLRRAGEQPSASDGFSLRDGGCFPYLGVRTGIRCGGQQTVLQGHCLSLALPAGADSQQIGEAVARWVQQQARTRIGQCVARHSAAMPGELKSWALSSARSRWGCCTSNRTIRYSWRLLFFSPECIDYVVVHELAHLTEMNHGPRFWQLVARELPGWKEPEAALRRINLRDLPL